MGVRISPPIAPSGGRDKAKGREKARERDRTRAREREKAKERAISGVVRMRGLGRAVGRRVDGVAAAGVAVAVAGETGPLLRRRRKEP